MDRSSVKRNALICFAAMGLAMTWSQGAAASCSRAASDHAHIQWSEPATIVSPDRTWQVNVQPDFGADENRAPVTLQKCGESHASTLFVLDRNADLYWRADSSQLLIINQPGSGASELALFDTASSTGTTAMPSSSLDKDARSAVQGALGAARKIQFYLMNFVAWYAEHAVLSVSGATSSGGDGPMSPYCYGVVLDTRHARVQKIMQEDELKSAYRAAQCPVSP
jgi:hypothetical protein